MLQRDFGGDEVIFDSAIDGAPAVQVAMARPLAPLPPRPPTEEPLVADVTVPRPAPGANRPPSNAVPALDGKAADWRKDAPPIPGPGLSVSSVSSTATPLWQTLDEIAAVVRTCTLCPLCRTRTLAVPGEGDPRARLMLVGEGPGESEDLSGRPFVGRAGDLLDRMLASIEIQRTDTFIANVVKCRPPKNRVPLPDERNACLPYLRRQIALVQPRLLVALGGTATEALLGVKKSLGELRLKVHEWNGIPLIVTYHPAALLRNPAWKRPAWDDIRIARQLLDRGA